MNSPSPRKILLTADPVGGVWTYALELARALAPHGAEIALATMGDAVSAGQRAEVAALPNVQLHESRFQLEWMDEPWADVDRAGNWLLELAANFTPDVVHLNGFCHGALPWPAPVLVVAHSCVLSWWAAVRGEEAPPRYDEYRRRVRTGLLAADAIVAPTAAMLDALEDYYGPLPSGQVIHNAREAHGFAPARKQLLIFSAGRVWDEAKNVGALDRVAPFVRWPVHIAGSVEHPNGSHLAKRRRARQTLPGGHGGATRRERHLRAARPLRTLRPLGARSGAMRLRAGTWRHSEPARGLG